MKNEILHYEVGERITVSGETAHILFVDEEGNAAGHCNGLAMTWDEHGKAYEAGSNHPCSRCSFSTAQPIRRKLVEVADYVYKYRGHSVTEVFGKDENWRTGHLGQEDLLYMLKIPFSDREIEVDE